MYIAALAARCEEVYPSKTLSFAISVPPNASEAYKVHLLDCCAVAGISTSKIFLSSSTDCLVTTYGRKLSGLRPPERALLEGKHILLLDMGHTSTSVVVLQAFEPIKGGNEGKGPIKCGEAFSDALGGHVFDLQMYSHFAKVCETKHATKIEAGTKRSSRLLDACERLRKLLSQVNISHTQ